MGQIKLTEEQLKKIMETISEVETTEKELSKPKATVSHPVAQEMFNNVKNYMEGLSGGFLLTGRIH